MTRATEINEDSLREVLQNISVQLMPSGSRMDIARIFNPSGEDDVLLSLDDSEIVDGFLQYLEVDGMNVQEDFVEKQEGSVSLPST